MRHAAAALAVLSLACSSPASVPPREPQRTPAPIPENVADPIRGLDAGEREALRSGEGMGLARAAERNGVPGPKHVLELTDSLGLSPAQRDTVQRLFDRMNAEARALGAEILAGEAGLETSLRLGRATTAEIDRTTRLLGEQYGRLRAIHLRAHLATAEVLTAEQRERYMHLRAAHH